MPAGAGAKPGHSWKAPQLLKPLVTVLKTVLELPQIIQESCTAGNCTGFILLKKLLPGAHPALLAAVIPLQGLKVLCSVLGSASSPWPLPGMLLSHIKLSPAFFFSSKALGCPLPLQFLTKAKAQNKPAFVFFRVLGAKTLLGQGQLDCASWEMLVTHG